MLKHIDQFKMFSPRLATGGQPTVSQFEVICDQGYQCVINLGLVGTEYAIDNEKQLVESLGMQYFHIPVDFQSPQLDDYLRFASLYLSICHKNVFVHCAANKRVSVFIGLFRMIEENIPKTVAQKEIHEIWTPNDVWQNFMENVLNSKKCKQSI